MCNLAIAIQATPGNAEVRRLVNGQFGKMSSQPDGICSLIVGEGQKVSVERKLKKEDYAKVFTKALDGLKENRLVAVHTRIASVGNVSDENVHFFRYGSRYFAHNGHVSDYTKKTTSVYGGKFLTPMARNTGLLSSKKLGKAMRSKSSEELKVERATVEERMARLADAVDDCKECEKKSRVCKNHEGVADEILALEALLANGKILNIKMIPDEDTGATARYYDGTPTPYRPNMGQMFDTETGRTTEIDKLNASMWPDTEGRLATEAERNLDPSDSLLFLQNMPKEIDILALNKYSEDKGYSGVGLLVDEDKKKAWLMTTRQCDVHTDGKGYLIVYSFLPNKEFSDWQYVMGVPIVKAEDKRYPTATLSAGIYEIDLAELANDDDLDNKDILSECL